MPPKFLYFDLGNVLLHFDHHRAARQMGEVAGVSEQKVWDLVFASDLELRYEAGEIDDRGFYDIFCKQTETRPDFDRLLWAGSEIFSPNLSIFPLIAALDAAEYRMGILSNTCPGHWKYCSDGRYGLIHRSFDVHALSYELGACKPDPKIFQGASQLAGQAPGDIFSSTTWRRMSTAPAPLASTLCSTPPRQRSSRISAAAASNSITKRTTAQALNSPTVLGSPIWAGSRPHRSAIESTTISGR
jgi:FMN phosphatase YigB (HAD superfamily)